MTIYNQIRTIPKSGHWEEGTALRVQVSFETGDYRRFSVHVFRPIGVFATDNLGPQFDNDAQVILTAQYAREILDELIAAHRANE